MFVIICVLLNIIEIYYLFKEKEYKYLSICVVLILLSCYIIIKSDTIPSLLEFTSELFGE